MLSVKNYKKGLAPGSEMPWLCKSRVDIFEALIIILIEELLL